MGLGTAGVLLDLLSEVCFVLALLIHGGRGDQFDDDGMSTVFNVIALQLRKVKALTLIG